MGILDIPSYSRAAADAKFLTPNKADSRYATGAFAPLYGYYSTLSRARTVRCDIIALGDSIMEGQGSALVSDRWISKTETELRRVWMTGAGGPGYIPATYAAGPDATKFAAWTYSPSDSLMPHGPGYKARKLNQNSTATITKRCTSFKLFIYRLAGDVVTISIDGGAAVTWTVPVVTGTPQQVWTSPALTSGDHTVTVTCTSAGTSFCGGVFFDGDETAGLTMWDSSHSGATMKLYAETYVDWASWLTAMTADLLMIGCATNDCQVSTGGYSSAEFKTYAQTLITMAREKMPTLPIVFTPPYKPISTVVTIEPWANYIDKLHELAAENPYCAVFDMGSRIPDLTNDVYGFRADTLHPSSRGMAYMSALGTAALTPK